MFGSISPLILYDNHGLQVHLIRQIDPWNFRLLPFAHIFNSRDRRLMQQFKPDTSDYAVLPDVLNQIHCEELQYGDPNSNLCSAIPTIARCNQHNQQQHTDGTCSIHTTAIQMPIQRHISEYDLSRDQSLTKLKYRNKR